MNRRPRAHLPTLESLRGIAGFYIFLHHFAHFQLAPKYPWIGYLFPFGQVAVLGFFILSGFVIHYSCFLENPMLSARVYFIRRFRRIYPLYLVSIGISYLSLCWLRRQWTPVDSDQLLGGLLMLQDNHFGSFIAPLFGNEPTWSLSFEWFFYLMYYPLAFWVPAQDDTKTLMVGFLAAVAMLVHLFAPNQFSLFAIYFPVWWSGALLAKQYKSAGYVSYQKQKASFFTLGAVILLWCFLFVNGHSGHSFQHPIIELRRLLTGFALLIITLLANEHRPDLWVKILRPFTWLGSISYGIYVFHYPILGFIPNDGNPLLHFLWVAPLTIGLAYFFERIIQPQINKLFTAENSSLRVEPSLQP